MGKRWAGGGGRRPMLDLGGGAGVLRAEDAPSTAAAAPAAAAPAAEPTASDHNPLLGLIGGYADSDDEAAEEAAAAPAPAGVDNQVANFMAQLEGEGLVQDAAASPAPPLHWERCLDPGTNEYYFWNTQTNEVRWTAPDGWVDPAEAVVPAVEDATAEAAAAPAVEAPAEQGAAERASKRARTAEEQPEGTATAHAQPDAAPSIGPAPKPAASSDGVDAEALLDEAEEGARLSGLIGAAFAEFGARLGELARGADGGAAGVLRMQHQLEARREDWEAGALPSAYLWEKLQACSVALQELEAEGLPEGWTRAWDAESAAYYYANPTTGESSWEAPQPPPPPDEELAAASLAADLKLKARERRALLKEERRRREAGLPPLSATEALTFRADAGAGAEAGADAGAEDEGEAGEGAAEAGGGGSAAATPAAPAPAEAAAAPAAAPAAELPELSPADLEWVKKTSAKAPMHPSRLALLQSRVEADDALGLPPGIEPEGGAEGGATPAASATASRTASGAADVPAAKPPARSKPAAPGATKVFVGGAGNRKMGSLVQKWNQVRAEAQEEEAVLAEEERLSQFPTSVEELERAKRQRTAEWRQEQLDGDDAKLGDNANFQPLVGDWRARVAKARAQASK